MLAKGQFYPPTPPAGAGAVQMRGQHGPDHATRPSPLAPLPPPPPKPGAFDFEAAARAWRQLPARRNSVSAAQPRKRGRPLAPLPARRNSVSAAQPRKRGRPLAPLPPPPSAQPRVGGKSRRKRSKSRKSKHHRARKSKRCRARKSKHHRARKSKRKKSFRRRRSSKR